MTCKLDDLIIILDELDGVIEVTSVVKMVAKVTPVTEVRSIVGLFVFCRVAVLDSKIVELVSEIKLLTGATVELGGIDGIGALDTVVTSIDVVLVISMVLDKLVTMSEWDETSLLDTVATPPGDCKLPTTLA